MNAAGAAAALAADTPAEGATAAANLRSLLAPESVAIVGDTPGGGRGGWIHEALVANGYRGRLYPVNPKYAEIRGLRAYASLAELPEPVEFVAIAVSAAHAVAAVEQAAAAGAKAGLVIAAGFAEAGEEGRRLQDELRATAMRHRIALCGPNCYGIANLHGRFAAYGGPLARPLRPGPVALLFQSGALTHSVTDPSVQRSTGYSFIVTTGNEAVLEVADYLDVIADDPNTEVVACFIEGLKTPARFVAAATKAIERGKRVVVLKVGRSELGRRAAFSHTGAVAGEENVYDALFARLGVIRVSDLDELIETVELATHLPRIERGNPALVTISGGGAGIIADLCDELGLPLQPFAEATRARLTGLLPPFAHPNNPLDITGAVGENPQLLAAALDALADDEAVSLIALAVNSPAATDEVSKRLHQTMVEALCETAASGKARLVASLSSGAVDPDLLAIARAAGVPFLTGLREMLAAVARTQRATAAAERRSRPPWVGDVAPPAVADLAAGWPATGLSEVESKRLLAAAGVALPAELLATTAAEAAVAAARLGFPVVMKIRSADIAHKTDVGGVRIGVVSEDDAERTFAELIETVQRRLPSARLDGVSVQEQVGAGVDVLVGVVNHPGLGPAVAFGLGGIFVEELEDVVVRMAPVDEQEAAEMIDAIRGRRLLDGVRGAPAADLAALHAAVVRISELGWWLREQVQAIDINPLRVLPAGQGVRALDALVVPSDLESTHPRPPR